MCSEFDCGVCYRTYNAGRRCPRELHCIHSFCESCLRLLSRAPGPGDGSPPAADSLVIRCPLCRHPTVLTAAEGSVRAELRVDESVLERLLAAGVLDREDEPEEEEEEEEEAEVPEVPAEESDSSMGSRGGRLRRSWRKVWRRISGRSCHRQACMSNDEWRTLAMMSSYMF
ncbi:RING finger protein 186 [Austrofundulus limnaeus]|uniref:RING finger protein 186 n=1 Tax=Austrofundulus limnaeus TaxID=52670 RepID=A0A2I4CJ25_AUSLI|nr:PREDICTED: RING finger protein 186-like [Austrofundulus limnaeus]